MLFVKRGDRVEAEAAALDAARHPGVVELVEVGDGELRTRLVADARSLAEAGPLTTEEVAGVLASVATTLADLHDRGVVHGGIEAGHVLIGGDGRPLLCSLGRAGTPPDDVAALGRLAGDLLASPDGAASGPGDRASEPARPALGSRGRAWRARAGRSRRGGGPVPRHRAGRRRPARLGPMLAPAVAPVLAGLVAESTAADADARPTARALAAAVHQRAPTARLPAPPRPSLPLVPARPVRPSLASGRRTGWRRPGPAAAAGADLSEHDVGARAGARPPDASGVRGAHVPAAGDGQPGEARGRAGGMARAAGRGGLRLLGVVAAVVAANLVLAVAVVVISNVLADRGPGAPPAPVRPAPGSGGSGVTPPVQWAPSDPPPGAERTTSTPVAVRVWPPEPVDYRDGVLRVGAARYSLGRPGDAVVVGDWACTGRRTLVLLRPATGEVFAFGRWPDEGADAVARPVGTVDGATAVRAVDADGDGCDDVEVTRAGGPPVHVEVAR